ncbi:hypothetical protein K458DRAFT_62664 [Lentithecium fluviatile CBS 122367]|uniref:Uncharacterized protein n=1 Tax=Lentithecium fluviatile CBS 122367 TaxID=1168545 RepID=A0A6G1JKM2_9PLEO|nr:hypothetical protein K458DRAFT_62664 [Lentithecium fluviatile CBS 122367]
MNIYKSIAGGKALLGFAHQCVAVGDACIRLRSEVMSAGYLLRGPHRAANGISDIETMMQHASNIYLPRLVPVATASSDLTLFYEPHDEPSLKNRHLKPLTPFRSRLKERYARIARTNTRLRKENEDLNRQDTAIVRRKGWFSSWLERLTARAELAEKKARKELEDLEKLEQKDKEKEESRERMIRKLWQRQEAKEKLWGMTRKK